MSRYFNSRPHTPEVCPVCGEDVPPRAPACPGCDADHRSGWREDADLDGLDLADEEFDYAAFVEREFGPAKTDLHPVWWFTAVILLAAFVVWIFLSAF